MTTTDATHSLVIGYLYWLLGFTGSHRFYFGKPVTGIIWALTGGLLLIGWIVDLFLIPGMCRDAQIRFAPGRTDYSITWLLFTFLGVFGIHRFYMGKWVTGLLYLLTVGVFGLGLIYDILTLNDQISQINLSEHALEIGGMGL